MHYAISSGKFRRYSGNGFRYTFYPQTIFLNIRDMYRIAKGFLQSLIILSKEKPDAMFIKGGFVGVPMGIAAALKKVPFMTHDTDVLPGLANRVIARWARYHAVTYQKTADKYYKDGRAVLTGPIIDERFKPITHEDQKRAKQALGFDSSEILVLVTGGGLGARRLNIASATALQQKRATIQIAHIAGKGKAGEIANIYVDIIDGKKVLVEEFTTDMLTYIQAADIVITRAGATAMAEFAALKKACIVVPNQHLTGGHQILNARELESAGAACLVYESETLADDLLKQLEALLSDHTRIQTYGEKLYGTLRQGAAGKVVAYLLEVGRHGVV